ncbi:tyrosine-type recombinase/integrase [Rhizobium johnstonii]|uniref:tyrosine-type recombinase/integrase n=1 Tax=Rhizobium johnstonii TaxID=3019933 RepID=UPI003F951973
METDPIKLRLLMGSVWQSFEPHTLATRGVSSEIGYCVRLAILTLQRPGAIAGVKRRHLNLEKGLWWVHSENERSHQLHPLLPSSIELFGQLMELPVDRTSEAIFQNRRFPDKSVPAKKLTRIFAAVGKKFDLPRINFSGLRACARLLMLQSGIQTDGIDCVLGHRSRAPSEEERAVDGQHCLVKKRCIMMQWEFTLNEIIQAQDSIAIENPFPAS